MRKLVVFCALFIGVMTVSAQLSQHGLVLNGGIGLVDTELNPGFTWDDYKYKAGISVGYRFRFNRQEPKNFHYDLDVNAGIKFLNAFRYRPYTVSNDEESYVIYLPSQGKREDLFISVGGTVNYSIIKNFSIGLGIEPVYFYRHRRHYFKEDLSRIKDWRDYGYEVSDLYVEEKDNNKKFDLPVVAKVAYDFKKFEVGITGKYGLVNVFESPHLKSGRYGELQLSIFIPFKTK